MNREIKFRGYSSDHGWIYGDLNQYSNGECYITEHSDGQDLSYPIAPASVGQFTGLQDKNGRDIYEGDILDGGILPKGYVGFVLGCFYLYDTKHIEQARLNLDAHNSEVIGNIHDISIGNEEVQG